MPVPGLTDIYEFGEWMKKSYIGASRRPLHISPVQGGLIFVVEESEIAGTNVGGVVWRAEQFIKNNP